MPVWNSSKEREYQRLSSLVKELEAENRTLRDMEPRYDRIMRDMRQRYERERAWLRHQVQQAIQTEDTKNFPPQTAMEQQTRLFKTQYRREVYRHILSMMDAQAPPRFETENANDYSDGEDDDF